MKAVRNYQICAQGQTGVPMRHRPAARFAIALLVPILMLGLCVGQEANPQARVENESARPRADRNKVIYVSDFDLDPANFQQDKGGITGKGYLLPAPPKSPLRRKHLDPAAAASNLIRLMSESLVADLQKAGFKAQRLASTEPVPTEGLLVSGVFTELNEGNQMRRALLGFGSGKSKMELYVMVADASSASHPLYETSTQQSNGKGPGTVIALNPYAGAAGFVVKFGMTKNAPEKMVRQTASKIATELTKQLNAASLIAAEQDPNKQ
jgi:uncharacterized protein DUF4410